MTIWQRWYIRIAYGDEPLHSISQTIKARPKSEAESKAKKYLSGRGSMLFEVYLP